MITEQYVTFQTARLLKEAGFNCRVNRYFRIPGFSSEPKEMSLLTAMNINREPRNYSRPTQQLAARWLREVHGLNISACFNYNTFGKAEKGWFYMRDDTNRNDTDSVYCGLKDYKSYEDAFEAGLQEALELIIKNKKQ